MCPGLGPLRRHPPVSYLGRSHILKEARVLSYLSHLNTGLFVVTSEYPTSADLPTWLNPKPGGSTVLLQKFFRPLLGGLGPGKF